MVSCRGKWDYNGGFGGATGKDDKVRA